MRELSACDFCDASDAGTFEVLPPEVEGGRRMVLCDDCRTTLGGVVQPLLDHLAGGGDVEPDVGDVEPDVGGDAGGESAAGGADANPARSQEDRAEGGDAAGGSGSADAAGTEAGSADADSTEAGGADAGSATGGSDEGGAKMAATGAGKSSGVPRGYRKTVRFLENREFPMARENAVSMTSDAYGLDEEAVRAAIDHAIKHDRLTEFDGELRKP